MMLNPDMNFPRKFPDVERAEQLKAKERKKSSNPFAAAAKRKEKGEINQQLARDNPKVMWNTVIPKNSVPLADSGTSMAAEGSSMGRDRHQARMLLW